LLATLVHRRGSANTKEGEDLPEPPPSVTAAQAHAVT